MPADQIDVNVHPAKTEIRFKTEQEIYKLIFDWVKECLEKHPHIPVISRESFERSDYNGSQTDDRSGLPDTALDTQRQENRERIDKTVAESQQIDFLISIPANPGMCILPKRFTWRFKTDKKWQ